MKKPKLADTRLATGPQGAVGMTGNTGYTLETALWEISRLEDVIRRQYKAMHKLNNELRECQDEIVYLKKRIKKMRKENE